MKLRHAAALALAGWYCLIAPPVRRGSDALNPDAPLSQWNLHASYDSARDCERERRDLTVFLLHSESESPPANWGLCEKRVGDCVKCIGTDDPRLKGN